jgi:hypothetical protein
MKQFILALVVLGTGSLSIAKKDCTIEPKSTWMSEEAFKMKAEAEGYKISKFKQSGNCYEIYGKNKEGKKVEVYFNPVDGRVIKEEME